MDKEICRYCGEKIENGTGGIVCNSHPITHQAIPGTIMFFHMECQEKRWKDLGQMPARKEKELKFSDFE